MEVNITLVSILVIILLFIPGFFFKRFYYTGQFTKQFTAGSFAERFITSIFWGLLVQFTALLTLGRLTGFKYNNIRQPISKFYADLSNNQLPECTSDNFLYGMGYVLITIFMAILLGWASHTLVRLLRLDIYFPVLRFTNYWNYYFKGDLKELRSGNRTGKVISTNIDIKISDNGKSTLYSGFLAHYTISPNTGELETIALINAERYSNTAMRFKPVKGDSLIIPCSTIINLNLRYNIKQARRTFNRTRIANTIYFLAAISIMFYIPHKYNSIIGFWRILLAIIFAELDILFIYVLFDFLSKPQPGKTLSEKVSFVFAGIAFVSVISTILHLILSW